MVAAEPPRTVAARFTICAEWAAGNTLRTTSPSRALHICPDEPITGCKKPGTITRTAAFLMIRKERRMRDSQDRNSSISGTTLAVIVVAFVLALAVLIGGPWNTRHVASNPGPSGTPGSTTADKTPPPAQGPSGTTT